jgi:uncharacterized protein (TIGR02246 family)
MRKLAISVCLFAVALLGTSCSQNTAPVPPAAPVDHRAEDAPAIKALDADWVKAVQGKDLEKAVALYAENGVLLAPGAPMASGKEAIRKDWSGMMSAPGFALTFSPTRVEVARSGDLAYEVGEYALTMNDKRGKPQTSKGKYVVVWGKQPGGTWKVLVDAPTTTQ